MHYSSVIAWLTAPWRDRRVAWRRFLVGLLVAATIWGWVDVRRRGYPYPESPGEHKSDLTVYTEAGAAFFDGRPPYEVHNPRGWMYVYPPVFAMLLAPLHVLPMQDQVIVWYFLCLLMCWGAYRECARIVGCLWRSEGDDILRARWFPWLGIVAAATAALPTLNCLQRGQVSIVILYFLVLGLRLVLTGRSCAAWFLGGVALALPATIKIVPLLPIAFLVFVQGVQFVRSRRQPEETEVRVGRQLMGTTFGVTFGLVLFFILLPASLVGWKANLRHLGTWSHLVLGSAADSTATPGFEKDTHSVRNQCLGNALYRLGNFGAYMFAGGPEDPLVDAENTPPRLMDAPIVNTCLLFARAALLATMFLVGIRLAACRDTLLEQAAGFGLACAALLVVSPVARNHYFLLIAPAVLFLPLWFVRRGHPQAATILAVIPGILIGVHYLFMAYVGRVGILGLGTTGWLLAAMVLMDRAASSASPQQSGAGIGDGATFPGSANRR